MVIIVVLVKLTVFQSPGSNPNPVSVSATGNGSIDCIVHSEP